MDFCGVERDATGGFGFARARGPAAEKGWNKRCSSCLWKMVASGGGIGYKANDISAHLRDVDSDDNDKAKSPQDPRALNSTQHTQEQHSSRAHTTQQQAPAETRHACEMGRDGRKVDSEIINRWARRAGRR